MKKILFYILMMMVITSCGSAYSYYSTIYEGKATYYLPNGETKEYVGYYSESVNTSTNTEKSDFAVDYGNGEGKVTIFNGVPYIFNGEIKNTTGANYGYGSTYKFNIEYKDGNVEVTYNGNTKTASVEKFNELVKMYGGNIGGAVEMMFNFKK